MFKAWFFNPPLPFKVSDQSPPMRKSVFPFFSFSFSQKSLFGNKEENSVSLTHSLQQRERGRGCAKVGALPGHSFFCQGWKWQGGIVQWRGAHFLRPSSSGIFGLTRITSSVGASPFSEGHQCLGGRRNWAAHLFWLRAEAQNQRPALLRSNETRIFKWWPHSLIQSACQPVFKFLQRFGYSNFVTPTAKNYKRNEVKRKEKINYWD